MAGGGSAWGKLYHLLGSLLERGWLMNRGGTPVQWESASVCETTLVLLSLGSIPEDPILIRPQGNLLSTFVHQVVLLYYSNPIVKEPHRRTPATIISLARLVTLTSRRKRRYRKTFRNKSVVYRRKFIGEETNDLSAREGVRERKGVGSDVGGKKDE